MKKRKDIYPNFSFGVYGTKKSVFWFVLAIKDTAWVQDMRHFKRIKSEIIQEKKPICRLFFNGDKHDRDSGLKYGYFWFCDALGSHNRSFNVDNKEELNYLIGLLTNKKIVLHL